MMSSRNSEDSSLIPLLSHASGNGNLGNEQNGNNNYGTVRDGYTFSAVSLSEMVRANQRKFLENCGGSEGIAQKLSSSAAKGLDIGVSLEQRREEFGRNYVPPPPPPSYCELVMSGLEDTTIIMLIVSAAVSLVLGLGVEKDYEHGWIEGTSIIVSILVVVNVQAITDYSKAAEFRRQQLELENQQHTTVIRNGKAMIISPRELVVGDVLRFGVGDILPVDGVLLEASDVKMDESSLTGETNLILKTMTGDPFMLSGTNVMNGTGKLLVIAVGKYSVQGSILASVGSDHVQTVFENEDGNNGGTLVEKLDRFAMLIGKFGMLMATLTFILMLIRWLVTEFVNNGTCKYAVTQTTCDRLSQCSFHSGTCSRIWVPGSDLIELLNFVVTAITILVVAVPEGLPLAVTLSLAISMRRMTFDNNQVKHMDSCETMGSATTVCSDKTGTLTLNKMTVVKISFGHDLHSVQQEPGSSISVGEQLREGTDVSPLFREKLGQAVILNSGITSDVSLEENGTWKYRGNATECALLKLAYEMGYVAVKVRESNLFQDPDSDLDDWGTFFFPFSSQRKRMSYIVPRVINGQAVTGFRLYSKGAPDYILKSSNTILDSDGETLIDLTDEIRAKVHQRIEEYQRLGLRVIALGYRDFEEKMQGGWDSGSCADEKGPKPAEERLTFLGMVGIEDPLRPEVKDAIQRCNAAGVDVRMCTGDALATGVSIALQCGILKRSQVRETETGPVPLQNFAMTGPEFRDRVSRIDLSQSKVLRSVYDTKTGRVVERMEHPYLLDENGERMINQKAMDEIWPKLRVLARCQPEDKLTLVRGMRNSRVYQDKAYCKDLKERFGIEIFPDKQVVAVTGDGTNDAPALKQADVGCAMGIVGTDTAKQACDIVLLDDNFTSIVKAIMWGRNVYDSISKFIQFQLTVNVVAIVVAVIGATVCNESPLSAVQMLWINLIMDSLASLALATEPPTEILLDRKPYGKRRPILSKVMKVNILGQSVLQLAIVLTILFYPAIIPGDVSSNHEYNLANPNSSYGSTHWTILFNVFVWLQLFNEINSRKLQTVKRLKTTWSEWFVFEGITRNWHFVAVLTVTSIAQIAIIQVGGSAFKLCKGGLSLEHWIFCVGLGTCSLPWQLVVNTVMVSILSAEEEVVVVNEEPSVDERRRRWDLLRRNVRNGFNYARVFNTSVKKGMLINRVTLLRGTNRPNYRYPITKSDSLETEKIIRALARNHVVRLRSFSTPVLSREC